MTQWTDIVEALGKIGEVVILIGAVWIALNQLRKLQKQNELDQEQQKSDQKKQKLDQLVAWKTSLHSLNQLAMQDPETFNEVLYPEAKNKDEVRQLTAAYASSHALEVIYYMRRDEETPPDRLDAFLRQYVAGSQMRNAWKVEAAHAAFTGEFQKKRTR